MTRRKGEITSAKNERDNPHIVEMPVPLGGLGMALNAMHDWHRQRGVKSKSGRGWRAAAGADHIRWCFADPETADAFAEQFGGQRCFSQTRGVRPV
jgi:hypothetical protein